MDAERVPDADEAEADRLAEEEAAAAAAEEEALAAEKAARAERLAARLAAESGEAVPETSADETTVDETTVDETTATDAADATDDSTTGNVNEFGEEIEAEEEEETVVPDKYKTTVASVVRVEYEGGVSFILNYNSFAITVEYEGQTYTIDGLNFVRID